MSVVDAAGAFGDGGPFRDRLPARPDPDLDRVLDAVERCLARFGVRRTSMTDIARELGVARTTLYRQVRSLEEAVSLVASRRFHRFLDELVTLAAGGIAPRGRSGSSTPPERGPAQPVRVPVSLFGSRPERGYHRARHERLFFFPARKFHSLTSLTK